VSLTKAYPCGGAARFCQLTGQIYDSKPEDHNTTVASIPGLPSCVLRAHVEALSARTTYHSQPRPVRAGAEDKMQPKRRASVPSTGDPIARLERLGDLRDKGLLSDAEFEAKKAQLLERM